MAVKVTTGVARASYVNITEPKSINGSKPKYSSSLIIPKSDKATIKLIEDAIEQAIQEGVGKFGGKIPPRGSLKLPLRDGDTERDDEDYAGAYFINANSTFQPGVVDREGNITDALASMPLTPMATVALLQDFKPYSSSVMVSP